MIDKIDKAIGKENNLWVSSIRHCLLNERHRCADHVDESLTPIKDWTKVRERGTNNNNLHQLNDPWISLFSRFWFMYIVVMSNKKSLLAVDIGKAPEKKF